MSGTAFDRWLAVWLALAAASFVALLARPAQYGRYAPPRRRFSVPARWGWLAMESPAVLGFAAGFVAGRAPRGPVAWSFLALWLLHYVDRAWAYPFRLGDPRRPMPLEIVGLGVVFNLVNAGLQSAWLFTLSGGYRASWLADPRFLLGVALFGAGLTVNRLADARLRRLRAAGGYALPRGGLFELVACPNYLGEIVQWLGWALATWSLAGLAFALWTIANLAPRARSHLAWYRQRFPEFPADRRALVPGLW